MESVSGHDMDIMIYVLVNYYGSQPHCLPLEEMICNCSQQAHDNHGSVSVQSESVLISGRLQRTNHVPTTSHVKLYMQTSLQKSPEIDGVVYSTQMWSTDTHRGVLHYKKSVLLAQCAHTLLDMNT